MKRNKTIGLTAIDITGGNNNTISDRFDANGNPKVATKQSVPQSSSQQRPSSSRRPASCPPPEHAH